MTVEKNGFSPLRAALTPTFAPGAGATPGGSFLVTCALTVPFAYDAETAMSTLVCGDWAVARVAATVSANTW